VVAWQVYYIVHPSLLWPAGPVPWRGGGGAGHVFTMVVLCQVVVPGRSNRLFAEAGDNSGLHSAVATCACAQ
jgi:hypothetical protein